MHLDLQKYSAITLSYAVPGALVITTIAIGDPAWVRKVSSALDETLPASYVGVIVFVLVIWIGLIVDALRLILFQKIPALIDRLRNDHSDLTDSWDLLQLVDEQKRNLYEIQRNRWYSSYLVYANSSIAIILAVGVDFFAGYGLVHWGQRLILLVLSAALAFVGQAALGTFNKYAVQIAARSEEAS